MNRHDEGLNEDGAGPIEYLLTKLKTQRTHNMKTNSLLHSNNIWGVIKDLENNKITQFMFNKTTLIQRNINEIMINMSPNN